MSPSAPLVAITPVGLTGDHHNTYQGYIYYCNTLHACRCDHHITARRGFAIGGPPALASMSVTNPSRPAFGIATSFARALMDVAKPSQSASAVTATDYAGMLVAEPPSVRTHVSASALRAIISEGSLGRSSVSRRTRKLEDLRFLQYGNRQT
jgi:hypothetical protein